MKNKIETEQPLHYSLHINDHEKAKLHKLAQKLLYPFPSFNYEDFVLQSLQIVLRGLPQRVLNALWLMRVSDRAAGAFVIYNLPIDTPVPLTPASALRGELIKKTVVSEVVLTGISALLGEPVGHEEEKEGSLVHDLIPVVETDKPLSNEGSSVDFALHVENAIFPVRERFVVLFGQRQDRLKEAITPIVDVRDILPLLDKRIIDELFKKQFIIRRPYILDRSDVSAYSEPVAILSGERENPQVRVTLYEGGTKSVAMAGKEALLAFSKIANQKTVPYKIKPGQMVVINNYQALHGRTAFKAYGDGYDRYLLRSYLLESLWSVRKLQRISHRILNREES